jgi:hypothetical protein
VFAAEAVMLKGVSAREQRDIADALARCAVNLERD